MSELEETTEDLPGDEAPVERAWRKPRGTATAFLVLLSLASLAAAGYLYWRVEGIGASGGIETRLGGEVARRAFSVRMIGEVVGELRRVTWPSKEETLRLSIMVICVAAAVGAFLGLVDLGFARIMAILLGN